jgi:hypothetical protein
MRIARYEVSILGPTDDKYRAEVRRTIQVTTFLVALLYMLFGPVIWGQSTKISKDPLRVTYSFEGRTGTAVTFRWSEPLIEEGQRQTLQDRMMELERVLNAKVLPRKVEIAMTDSKDWPSVRDHVLSILKPVISPGRMMVLK